MIKLLMIDDNPLEHFIIQTMMDKFQLFPNATHSTNAETSIEFFENNYAEEDLLADVIFLDLSMPGFDGWEFLSRFKKLYIRIKKQIDIYIVSSSIDPKDKVPSQYSFVKGLLRKPLKMETLLNLYSLYQNIKQLALV